MALCGDDPLQINRQRVPRWGALGGGGPEPAVGEDLLLESSRGTHRRRMFWLAPIRNTRKTQRPTEGLPEGASPGIRTAPPGTDRGRETLSMPR